MRKFFTPGQSSEQAGHISNQPQRRSSLTLVHCNKHMAAAGRTTTTYIVHNDIVEAAPEEVSYYLLPDPYAGTNPGDEYYTVPDEHYY